MSATLKDLAPPEKQKVASLIRQVVEKERQLQEALATGAERAAQLAGQNAELARENTSLRAKLSHAFDLLRTYQHKCRVLDATAQVAGLSRPTSPAWSVGEGAGPPPAQPAAGLQGLEGSEGSEGGDACGLWGAECGSAAGGSLQQAEAGDAPARRGQLSPVAEGAWEGGSPAEPSQQQTSWQQQQQGRRRQQPSAPPPPPQQQAGILQVSSQRDAQVAACGSGCASPTAASAATATGIQLVAPAEALPQLQTLKVLAQALLEAQAEVAAKQQWQQQSAAAAAASLPAAAGAPPAPLLSVPAAAGMVFDASLGPHGGYLIKPQAEGSSSDGGSTTSAAGRQQAAGPLTAPARAPLAAVQQQAAALEERSASSCGPAATPAQAACSDGVGGWSTGSMGRVRPLPFDADLMDLVADVECLLPAEGRHSCAGGGSGGSGGTSATAAARWQGRQGAQYEENDVLSLIAQL